MNVQAACDGQRRFLWMSARFCGSAHDSIALRDSSLGEVLLDPSHPVHATRFWIAGDDAYKGIGNRCQSLLTPYSGRGLSQQKDSFNYHQSKLRIEIEAAFGALSKRWGILHCTTRSAAP